MVPIPGPTAKTSIKYKCIELGSALSAIFRAHALKNLHKLNVNLRAVLIPGEESRYDESLKPWVRSSQLPGQARFQLNPTQQAALDGTAGPVTMVQGPPGTGKSSFISECFHQRIPPKAKVLVCTSTNKAIDSLISKLEDSGLEEMLTVGSPDRMGEAAQRYLMTSRLDRNPAIMKAEAILAKATNDRETHEQIVARLAKPQRPKKAKDGTEQNRGFVERQFNKLKQDLKHLKKSPGIVRLLAILGPEITSKIRTNKDLYEATDLFLKIPAELEDAALYEERQAAKKALKASIKLETDLVDQYDHLMSTAARRTFRRARVVACTAASAVHVIRRLNTAVAQNTDDDEGDETDLELTYVVLDEAGSMLEPDAIGCLIHGAKALLLVGDHHQLPPFTKWVGAEAAKYNVSLMERLARKKPKNIPSFMLKEQYRMHPSLGKVISDIFYDGNLSTAAMTASARQNPFPVVFYDQLEGKEGKKKSKESGGGGSSWQNPQEAEEVLKIVRMLTQHGGHAQSQINVLTFYNSQRFLIANRLKDAKLADVDCLSVDSMQGREIDIVVLSCVRTGGLGFLSNWRRINVALSRARESIYVVGNGNVLRQDRRWANALDAMLYVDNYTALRERYGKAVAYNAMKPVEVVPEDPAAAEPDDEDEWAAPPDANPDGEEVVSDWDDSGDDDDAVPDAVAPLAAAVSKVKLDDEDHDDWEDRA